MKYRHLLTLLCWLLSATFAAWGQQNTISIPDVSVAKGKTISLPINLDNTADVVAVQFTLTVPDGITINTASASLTERSDGHSVTFRSIGANRYMAMVFSAQNKAIKGRTGKLMSVSLTAASSLDEGSELPLTLTDVVIGARDGANLATGFSAGKVTIATSPDLAVGQVAATEETLTPGATLHVSWTVTNVGGQPTTAGWSEQIFLQDDNGTAKLLGTTYHDATLAAEGTVSRNAELNVPNVLGLDGNCRVMVKLSPNSNAGEPSWLLGNNSAESNRTVAVEKRLSLSPAAAHVAEASAGNVRFQLTRSGSTANAETFVLDLSSDGRVALPQSVTIERGNASVYFYAQVTPNATLDNDSVTYFSIIGDGYPVIASTITLEDDTYPSLSLTAGAEDVTEGGSLRLTVSTQRGRGRDIEVKLTCNQTSRFRIPASIVIPAGRNRVEVTVEAVDDEVPAVEEVVTFTASAAGHNPATADVVLMDNDVPTLQMAISPTAVSEAAGPLSVTATLRRTDNTDKVVTVKLSDDSEGGIYYGRQTVTFEKGVEEIKVNLGPIDNATVEGERTYHITAAVWIASCSCNASNGTSGGVVTVPLTVYDNDGPTLTLTSSSSVLKEGGEMTIQVKRNTNTDHALTVSISSDHDADLEYPATVTIPAGETTASFTVRSKGNDTTGDSFTAVIDVRAEGFAKGNIWFTVSDQTLPDAQITDLRLSADEVKAGGSVTVQATLANTGSHELPELTKVGIYISNSSAPVATLYLQNSLPAGGTVVLTREITLPSAIGTYNVYAVANDGNGVAEINTSNNSSRMISVRTVSPYSVSVTTDKAVYNPGEKALISGRITGTDVADKVVELYVINDNYRHVMSTRTDAAGNFSAQYEPYPGQMGHFVLGACYPQEGLRTEMAGFDYYGIKYNASTAPVCQALLGDTYNGSYEISNPGNLALTGLTAEVVSAPANCHVTVNCPSAAGANSVFNVNFAIDATAVSEGNEWQLIEVLVRSAEGVSLRTTIYYYCRNKQGQLKADIARINTTMVKGGSRDYPFTITNVGQGATGKITLELPSWMTTVTPREMASLESGESTSVILRLTPTESMQLNVPVSGTIGLNCTNGQGMSLPFYIEPVSESTGMMVIDVCDENTYYAAGNPHLAGASVTVTHPTTGAAVASGTTGDDGKYRVELPEGYYTVSVTAPGHNSYRNNLMVDPGVDNVTVVNLSIEAITVDWRVEETTVEDEYSIVTTVTYETNVPVPVVELNIPQSIDAKSLHEGESLIFYARLTNKGLIPARDVQLELPTGFRALSFEALSHSEPFDLAPQQSVQIPVKVTHITNTATQSAARVKPIDNDPCVGQVGTLYYWDCGNDRKWHRYGIALQLGSCNSNDSTTWSRPGNSYGGGIIMGPSGPGSIGPGAGGGGGVYFGSSSESGHVTTREDKGCEPCQNKFMLTLVDCGLQLVPRYKVLSAVIGCVSSTYNTIKLVKEATKPDSQIKAVQIAGSILETTSTCMAAKSAGSGDKNASRAEKRAEAIESIVTTLGTLTGKIAQGGETAEEATNWSEIVGTLGSLAQSLSSLAGFDYDHLEDLFCPLKLLEPCDLEGPDTSDAKSPRLAPSSGATPSYIQEFREVLARAVVDQMAVLAIKKEFYGNINWLDADNSELNLFLQALEAAQDDNGHVSQESIENLINVKPQNITRNEVCDFINRWNSSVNEETQSEGFDMDLICKYYDVIQKIESDVASNGYETIGDFFEVAYKKCKENAEAASASVCASITLQFSQQMVMTRQAFRGTLTVFNGNDMNAMTDVKLNLTVKDQYGTLATSREFQISPEKLSGFEGQLDLDGGWTLNPQQTGVATILFIPTKYAAPTVEKPYSFGGTLSYTDPFTGVSVTRELMPVTLTVKPAPNLDLTYFMQRDVMGDDPLTTAVEPSEEAEFALLIHNVGNGDAANVRMYTEQPKIIDNEKGLLIDFELVSSQLNGADKTLALGGTVATELGNIPAQGTAYAQWWIKSSLLGHFTTYNVEATHLSSYGNPDLSLLNEVSIHELIRSLEVESGNERLVGFMTNDMTDADDTPDMLYLTDGTVETVATVNKAAIGQVSATGYRLTISTAEPGWNYGSVADPTYGRATLKSVIRQSDGKEMPLRNFWQTDRTLRDGRDPLYENRIHFADNLAGGAQESYLLTFEATPELTLEVASIENVPQEGTVASEPLQRLNVMFNKYIDPATFTTDDIALAVQGVKQDVSSIGISTEDNKTFTLDFTNINATVSNGHFVFTVYTDDVKDTDGHYGKKIKQVSWIMFRDSRVVLNISSNPALAGTVELNGNAAAASEASQQTRQTVAYGSDFTLSANAANGYEFKHWTVNGETVSTDAVLAYTALEDMDIVANYSLKTFPVTVGGNEEGGSVSGAASGVYAYGDVLTVIANADEDYVFEAWNVNGQPVSSEPELSVTVDQAKDIQAVFRRDLFLQTMQLSRGWNWVSSYVAEPVAAGHFLGHVTRIVSQFDEVINDPLYGMTGGIDSLRAGQAYKMEASLGTLKSFKGHLHNLQHAPIGLHTGWNWISYPFAEERNINDVLTDASEGDVMTSQYGFSEFYDGVWEGTLNTLTPGLGYIYKSATDKDLAYDFTAGSQTAVARVAAPEADAPDTSVDVHKYPSTMNVIASVQTADAEADNEQYCIYAFAGNECRGESRFVGGKHYLTVYGDEATDITFVVKHTANGGTYLAKEHLTFSPEVVGSRRAPYTLTIAETTGIDGAGNLGARNMKVYSIDGVLVNPDATLADILKLERGVYIIDGQKFIVK